MTKSTKPTPGISFSPKERAMLVHLCDASEDWSAPIHMDVVRKLGYADRMVAVLERIEEACVEKNIPLVGGVIGVLSNESGADIHLGKFRHMGKVRGLLLRVFEAGKDKNRGQFVSVMGLPQDQMGRRYFPENMR